MDRNKLGQYMTPVPVANDIVKFALELIDPSKTILFLEPGFGYGAFYNALRQSVTESRINRAWGFEVDSEYVEYVDKRKNNGILDLRLADFTTVPLPSKNDKVNLLLCNPPYVRHHHLLSSEKRRLSNDVQEVTGIRLNGRAGLYCYFLLLAHGWLKPGAISGWLLPSEFMDTEYGNPIRKYLSTKVLLHRIHRFDPRESLFEDAIVSSTVVFFSNKTPNGTHNVILSFGGTISSPTISSKVTLHQLRLNEKWSNLFSYTNNPKKNYSIVESPPQVKLSDFFEVKRGIATGANDFFILPAEKIQSLQVPDDFLKPILPSSRYLKEDEIKADEYGEPVLSKKLYLIDCKLTENEIRREYPRLWEYYEKGIEEEIHLRTLCRSRTPWFSQELRPPAPIICKYMGNISKPGCKPVRFILNHSRATATNSYYLLYPRPLLQDLVDSNSNLMRLIWESLNKITYNVFQLEGRTYGGGMFKIEPAELENIPIRDFRIS